MVQRITSDEAMRRNLESPFVSSIDFSSFKFINIRTKATYFCKIHNKPFEMLPWNFWNGHGCSECGFERSAANPKKPYVVKIRKSNESVLAEFKAVHADKGYDYSRVNYQKNNLKVEIICNRIAHGSFSQTPNKHLLGRGCPKCANASRNDGTRRSLDEFINASKAIHTDFYDYSETVYTGALNYVQIICPNHGRFSQKANDHLNGHGCEFCAREANRLKLVKTKDQVINAAVEVHSDYYDYSKVEYKGIYEKIEIICPIHKEFFQIANSHLRGQGCPKCRRSKGELLVSRILDKYNILYKEQYKFQECKNKNPLPFDFYLINHNVCIEYQGRQHYEELSIWGGEESFRYGQINDSIKKDFCSKNKIKLIEIPYTIDGAEIEHILLEHIVNKAII